LPRVAADPRLAGMRALLPLLLCSTLLAGCQPDVAVEDCPRGDGELTIEQIHLPPPIGESALITTPDDVRLLVDVGDRAHADAVLEATDGVIDYLLVTHPDRDHAGGLPELEELTADAEEIDEPGSWSLGGGVQLDVFLVDGQLVVGDDELDLRDDVPGLQGSDNARSTAGVVRWGDFVYVFAGDLTGGGKGTPDVESAVAERGAELLLDGDADVVHLSHHGIRSSTNPAWVDWLLPDDGEDRNAVVGANRGYLAAPHDEVVARVGPRLGGGRIHATETGSLADPDPMLVEHRASIHVAVSGGGANYQICGEAFESTAR
jgi:hypothetical protein